MINLTVINATTGTHETIYKDNPFTIYPNPASTKLFVRGENTQYISITDLTGQKVVEKTFAPDAAANKEIDISSLAQGIYFIRAANEIRKFVKE